jgi:hypothetical protein
LLDAFTVLNKPLVLDPSGNFEPSINHSTAVE